MTMVNTWRTIVGIDLELISSTYTQKEFAIGIRHCPNVVASSARSMMFVDEGKERLVSQAI